MERDERVAAYVDGELAVADAAAFEVEMTADTSLADAVARQRRLRQRLTTTYGPVLDEPVPLRLAVAAEAANDPPRHRWGLPQWSAVAASLVVGVLGGRAAIPENDPLALRGELARTLDKGLTVDAGTVQVGLTFRKADGRYCRTFFSEQDRLAGLACRSEAGWSAHTLTAWRPVSGPTYRTAGAETPPAILAAVDALIVGEPLDATAERLARSRGWGPEGAENRSNPDLPIR